VGEIIYNFRAALDYLVCTLSKADTPVWVGKRRNQCAIERAYEGFRSRRDTFLAGLSDEHVRALEAFQPSALVKGLTNGDIARRVRPLAVLSHRWIEP
jgi:hypothetical protein